MASQLTNLKIVYSTVYSGTDQRKHQSSASLALWGQFTGDRWIPRRKGQLRGKIFHLMASSWLQSVCVRNVPSDSGGNKMGDILQTTFSNVFFGKKSVHSYSIFSGIFSQVISKSALIRVIAWRPTGDTLLTETVISQFPEHTFTCITRPQWVKCAHGLIVLCFVRYIISNC